MCTRPVFIAVASLALAATPARTAGAQDSAPAARSWEFRVTSGAFVPTGSERGTLKSAKVSAAQLAWMVRPALAVTATFGWARSRDLASSDTPKLDVFTSDLGLEARPAQWFAGRTMTFAPFVGAGAGARSYNYRSLDVPATHNLAAYGSMGGELGVRRVGVRLEVRDYATGFRPLVGTGKSAARNDVVFMGGLRLRSAR